MPLRTTDPASAIGFSKDRCPLGSDLVSGGTDALGYRLVQRSFTFLAWLRPYRPNDSDTPQSSILFAVPDVFEVGVNITTSNQVEVTTYSAGGVHTQLTTASFGAPGGANTNAALNANPLAIQPDEWMLVVVSYNASTRVVSIWAQTESLARVSGVGSALGADLGPLVDASWGLGAVDPVKGSCQLGTIGLVALLDRQTTQAEFDALFASMNPLKVIDDRGPVTGDGTLVFAAGYGVLPNTQAVDTLLVPPQEDAYLGAALDSDGVLVFDRYAVA